MQLDVVTLFPQWFDWFTEQRHVANALAAGNELRALDLREHTPLSGGQVDDTPFGGGAGMVLRVDVVDHALRGFYGVDPVDLRRERRVIALTPGGRILDEALVNELAAEPARDAALRALRGLRRADRPALLQRRGVDRPLRAGRRRARGDGRLRRGAAQAARARSATPTRPPEESFSEALGGDPEYPHYTRPAEYRGWSVPDVLLSGHHEEIRRWRRARSRERGARGRLSGARRGVDRRARLRYPDRSRGGLPAPSSRDVRPPSSAPSPRASLRHEHRHRKPRARPAAPGPELRPGDRVQGPLPGRRGHPPPHPGLRGRRHQAPGPRRTRDVHRPQAVVRRRRGAHVPGALAEDRAASRSPPAATSAARSSTTCATASASAPACASAATSVPRTSSSRACSTRTRPSQEAQPRGRGRRAVEAEARSPRRRGGRGARTLPPRPRSRGRARGACRRAQADGRAGRRRRGRHARRRRSGVSRTRRSPEAKSTGSSMLELVVIVAVALGLALGDPGVPRQAVPDPERVDGARRSRSASASSSTASASHFGDPKVGDILVFHPPAGAESSTGDQCGEQPSRAPRATSRPRSSAEASTSSSASSARPATRSRCATAA